MGAVLSDLVRKGLQESPEYTHKGLFPTFNVPSNFVFFSNSPKGSAD
ncbi:hypothetical protein SAMN02745130_02510 [Thiothrix eikelboomii]|uniref:Uncharacterized protein n=1 Tax=Thiothrix eikelboomii TaxID=92487 RepID=A0A1T4X5V4_9GAMM|nr:hypothetical protein SAMN02745130_02510 [Thiothrix eikelboomii]